MSDKLAGLEIEGARATYRPLVRTSFDRAVALVRAAIDAASELAASELLMDTQRLTGFASPDTFERLLAAVVSTVPPPARAQG